jgi:hypothetical protein
MCYLVFGESRSQKLVVTIAIPDYVDFPSLMPLIRGERHANYEAVYGAYKDLQRMVRRGKCKLIQYPKIGTDLLFDLEADPLEMNGLAGRPEYASLLDELRPIWHGLHRQAGGVADPEAYQPR